MTEQTHVLPAVAIQEEGLDVEAALKAVQAATALARPNRAFLADGDVRMGDFILLVDSDTRVPEHCILPVVSELLRSPQVAFTQHYTTPLQASPAPPPHPALLPHAAGPQHCLSNVIQIPAYNIERMRMTRTPCYHVSVTCPWAAIFQCEAPQ